MRAAPCSLAELLKAFGDRRSWLELELVVAAPSAVTTAEPLPDFSCSCAIAERTRPAISPKQQARIHSRLIARPLLAPGESQIDTSGPWSKHSSSLDR